MEQRTTQAPVLLLPPDAAEPAPDGLLGCKTSISGSNPLVASSILWWATDMTGPREWLGGSDTSSSTQRAA